MERLGISDALGLLREELAKAQEAGKDHQFRFEITEAEVELMVEFLLDGEVGGKAVFGVAALSAKGERSRTDTHRIRLKLAVKDAAVGGRNLEVGKTGIERWSD